jgi:hypothetical protein
MVFTRDYGWLVRDKEVIADAWSAGRAPGSLVCRDGARPAEQLTTVGDVSVKPFADVKIIEPAASNGSFSE